MPKCFLKDDQLEKMMELFFVGENPKGLAKSDLERNPMNSTIQFYPVKSVVFVHFYHVPEKCTTLLYYRGCHVNDDPL